MPDDLRQRLRDAIRESGPGPTVNGAAEAVLPIVAGWRERAETAERRLAALDELHPVVELSWYHPCPNHSITDEAGVLDSCPDCTVSTYMGCPRCDDDCQVRAIIHAETPDKGETETHVEP